MAQVHIWIDADSCPSLVRNHCIKIAEKLNLKISLVANKNIPCTNQNFEMIICSEEKDAADNYIIEHADLNDLVITRDIVFADKLVSKKITVINDRGTIFTDFNIKSLLSERNYSMALADIGLVKRYNEGYDKKKFGQFANCFDKTLTQLLKR
ncbi:MAG: DUF188 domain-containing protein [Treponema sp.]|nr:DUF188 domain-containing protein [Treponema sp.]